MKTVLFIRTRYFNRPKLQARLVGVHQYARLHGWTVRVVEAPREQDIPSLLKFWNPIGCILEAGSWKEVYPKRLFGRCPIVYLDRDPEMIRDAFCVAHDPKATSGSLQRGYGAYALRYPYCEIRNTLGLQQEPVVVRLHDKKHAWDSLPRIVADMIGAGLIGQPFICPDMVGGGSWTAFIPGAPLSQELFIRSAQVQALCPMMQISASPWRYLDADHQRIFADVVRLRQKFAPEFVKLAKESAKSGEPIMRNLEYNYPGCGYAAIKDEFMMGTDLLVAPVVESSGRRKVVIPPGRWVSDDGVTYDGPTEVLLEVPLSRLPHFRRGI